MGGPVSRQQWCGGAESCGRCSTAHSICEAFHHIEHVQSMAVGCCFCHEYIALRLGQILKHAAQVTTAAPFNLRSEARHAAAEEKLAAQKAEVAAAAKRAASFKVSALLCDGGMRTRQCMSDFDFTMVPRVAMIPWNPP